MSQPTIWGVHAGVGGAADALFAKGYVAVGWPLLGSLAGASLDQLKERLKAAYPAAKPGAVPGNAAVLRKFLSEMQVGDYVISPNKAERTLRLGRIAGSYEHRPDLSSEYPNVRKCEWLKELPRTRFSQTALHEIGSALTLFVVREHAQHVLRVFNDQEAPPENGDAPDIPDAVETTEDFIVRRLESVLKGAPLERFVSDLLEAMDYRCRLTKTVGDGGIDVEACRGPLGFEPPIVKAQVKSTTSTIGDGDVKHLFASVNQGEFGLFVTLGSFSKAATEFARTKPNLSLVGGKEFVSLILEHYENLSPASKAIIPLTKTYVPDVSAM